MRALALAAVKDEGWSQTRVVFRIFITLSVSCVLDCGGVKHHVFMCMSVLVSEYGSLCTCLHMKICKCEVMPIICMYVCMYVCSLMKILFKRVHVRVYV